MISNMKLKKLGHIALLASLSILLPQSAKAFYNASTGRWLTRDPAGAMRGSASYDICENQPVSKIDWNGLLTITVGKVERRDCADKEPGTDLYLHFTLRQPAAEKGYMIIHNTLFTASTGTCDLGIDCPPVPGTGLFKEFWEAFDVDANSNTSDWEKMTGYGDHLSFKVPYKPTCGESSVDGEVRFYYRKDTGYLGGDFVNGQPLPLPPGWHEGGDSGAPSKVPYTWTEPAFWRTKTIVEGPALRGAFDAWSCGCCCCSDRLTFFYYTH